MSDARRISFEVPGTPGAQGRPKVSSFAGHARAYKAKKDTLYEGHVRDSFYRAAEHTDWLPAPGKVPLAVSIAAIFEPPSGMRKAQRAEIAGMWWQAGDCAPDGALANWLCSFADGWPGAMRAKRPDLDNITKAILDGLNGHAFRDDAQVVKLEAVKIYGSPARTLVQIVGIG